MYSHECVRCFFPPSTNKNMSSIGHKRSTPDTSGTSQERVRKRCVRFREDMTAASAAHDSNAVDPAWVPLPVSPAPRQSMASCCTVPVTTTLDIPKCLSTFAGLLQGCTVQHAPCMDIQNPSGMLFGKMTADEQRFFATIPGSTFVFDDLPVYHQRDIGYGSINFKVLPGRLPPPFRMVATIGTATYMMGHRHKSGSDRCLMHNRSSNLSGKIFYGEELIWHAARAVSSSSTHFQRWVIVPVQKLHVKLYWQTLDLRHLPLDLVNIVLAYM